MSRETTQVLGILFVSFLLFLAECSGHRHDIHWDTVWVGTGIVERHDSTIEVPRQEDTVSNTLPAIAHAIDRPSIRKRMVYGSDDRIRVDPTTEGSQSPYNSVVRVSTGCSGMLVSPKHVLAASHCVHDGNDYLLGAKLFLRAGYLQSDGRFKWTFVRRFFVPVKWRNHTSDANNGWQRHQYTDWADYDFSVLELAEEMGGNRLPISPGLSGAFCNSHKTIHGAGSMVEFVSFPDDKPKDAMWLVTTTIETETPHLLYFKGDAWHGSSGAALYAWEKDPTLGTQQRRVVGVLSGNRDTESEAAVQGNFNVAVRLDPVNLLTVCKWIGTESECRSRYADYFDEVRLKTICDPR